MAIDFVDEAPIPEKDALISLNASREAIFRAQRQSDNDSRERIRAAAAAEERAQVLNRKPVDEKGEPPSLEQVYAGNPTTIEALHAQIRLIRAKAEAKKETAPAPTLSPRMAARIKLEMEAGARANERALKQRELELNAGKQTAEALPSTPVQVSDTVNTPVHRPNEPTPGVDQNKPFTLTRGG